MAKVTIKNYTFERGDDKSLPLVVQHVAIVNGIATLVPKDITGWTFIFTAKLKPTDPDNQAVISKVVTNHTDAAGGFSAIPLTQDDLNQTPRSYPYDIKIVDQFGNRTTMLTGKLKITQDVGPGVPA